MQEVISKVIGSRKRHRPMDHAAEQWVRDVATEFGFKRGNVAPEDCAADPWDYCRFTVCRVTYEVHDYRLSIVGQE